MASQLEAIEIKRKMFFEFEDAPYHCIDVEVSKPTARGGQTLVRLKMRNLLTRAVFDKTFKAGDKFAEPDLELIQCADIDRDVQYLARGQDERDRGSDERATACSQQVRPSSAEQYPGAQGM